MKKEDCSQSEDDVECCNKWASIHKRNITSRKAYIRRREMALRFIAYNIRLIIMLNYARKHNLSMWVKAKK